MARFAEHLPEYDDANFEQSMKYTSSYLGDEYLSECEWQDGWV